MTNKASVNEKNTIVYYSTAIEDRTKLMGIDAQNLRRILNEVLIDTGRRINTRLGEYRNTLHYLIEAVPVQNYVLLECADRLREVVFENFSVKKIFVRYNKKEIVVVSDKMSDDVLEEFYSKTFELSYKEDSEIVFLITTDDAIDYSVMPKYDKLIEVVKHE